ncbi:MAG: response regulator [Geminicoccaceae bacterium]
MKKRALFVDDEPMVLSGLRRMLRSLRHDWEMSFANSGQEALALLEEEDFAVVISDMRMPEMDGATLLNEVAGRHPAAARLVLSGHAELDAILRAVRPAHQFLAKPCDPKLLEQALQRILQVGCDVRQDEIRTKLGAHRRLPSPSSTIEALRTALSATPADLESVGTIIGSDIAMSIQVLRLVNSAFFGPPTRTLDPRRAVSVLGADILISLVDNVGLFRPVDSAIKQGEAAVTLVNQRAVELASTTRTDVLDHRDGTDPAVWAMMSLAGSLAAVETPDMLDKEGEQALSKLLLAYWGLDVDISSIAGNSGEVASHQKAELLGV